MLEIKKVGTESISIIKQLAYSTWPIAYKDILAEPQLNYMLELIYSEPALTHQIDNLHHQFIVIYEHDSAVGMASYSQKKTRNSSLYHLHKLYVLPEQQTKGTGSELLTYIIENIKAMGAITLSLNVNRQNSAINFYKKAGFFIAGEEDIDIGNGYFMNDYVMEKSLF